MGKLLAGLDEFGLGELANQDVFEDRRDEKEKEKKSAEKNTEKHERSEEDYLFERSYTCPVCEYELKAKAVRAGKTKLLGTDLDLRPRYLGFDPLKYDTVLCPRCGYTAISRFFLSLTYSQAKLILEKISPTFHAPAETHAVYSYDDAILRNRLALVSAMVKKSKVSEKAYICLKTAWLIRGKREEAEKDRKNTEEITVGERELLSEETEFLDSAYNGFSEALQTESFPICGMDETTVILLLAELSRKTGRMEEAARFISRILTSRVASERVKDKAREIKNLIHEAKNE